MKKGKWNYTEDIEYKVLYVKILKDENAPYHWQNAFVGENRQVVYVRSTRGSFVIDNHDGSGIYKIEHGGEPDQYHASVSVSEYICDVPEEMWKVPVDIHAAVAETMRQHEAWLKANHPEPYEKLMFLRDMTRRGVIHVNSRGKIAPGEHPERHVNGSKPTE